MNSPLRAVLVALVLGVLAAQGTAQAAPRVGRMPSAALIARVDAILNHSEATPADVSFLTSLSQSDFDGLWDYYGEHPRPMGPQPTDTELKELPTAPVEVQSALGWTFERIECGYGWFVFGSYRASSLFHTADCGGDTDDHFYQYTSIPSAYSDRGRLAGNSVDPRVLLALGKFGWGLSARVYDNGYVLTCVGGGIHRVGLSHADWNSYFALHKK